MPIYIPQAHSDEEIDSLNRTATEKAVQAIIRQLR